MDDALKIRGINYSNVETWLLFVPPIKISGNAPDDGSSALFASDGKP